MDLLIGLAVLIVLILVVMIVAKKIVLIHRIITVCQVESDLVGPFEAAWETSLLLWRTTTLVLILSFVGEMSRPLHRRARFVIRPLNTSVFVVAKVSEKAEMDSVVCSIYSDFAKRLNAPLVFTVQEEEDEES